MFKAVADYLSSNGVEYTIQCDGLVSTPAGVQAIYRATLNGKYESVVCASPMVAHYMSIRNAVHEYYGEMFPVMNDNVPVMSYQPVHTATIHATFSDGAFLVPIGKFKGQPLSEVPLEFVQHWSEQEKNGGDLDILIQKCRDFLNAMPTADPYVSPSPVVVEEEPEDDDPLNAM